MEFTVVIPLYNKAPHIERAIHSALNQTLAPREVIVVDDGSTDGGADLVNAILDTRVRLLRRSPPGPGGYAARNLGIAEAVSEWIAFLDADDLWMPSHLDDLSVAIRACADPVGCAFTRFNMCEEGRSRTYHVSDEHLRVGKALSLATMLRAWLAAGRCPLWTGAVAFRREVLTKAGPFPAGRALRGGDKDLWLRAMAIAPTAYSPAISAEFHQDTVNRVTKTTRHPSPPVITRTIPMLLPTASPEEAKLLRQLSNHELALYMRYALGARHMVGQDFLRAVFKLQAAKDVSHLMRIILLGEKAFRDEVRS